MLRVGKQPLVGRSTGSPTLKEAVRETTLPLLSIKIWIHTILTAGKQSNEKETKTTVVTCPGRSLAMRISLCTGLISCGPYYDRKRTGYGDQNSNCFSPLPSLESIFIFIINILL
jgi:hypothetical protein